MGNLTSTLNTNTNSKTTSETHSFKKFDDAIDFIASKYILTSDFQSLKKLSEREYCEKLVVLTSEIIDRYFNHQEVSYLEQRVKNGVEVNDMTQKNVYFLNKDQLDNLDVSQDRQKGIKKKRVCIGIAKFYVKIAHIFAAILMTINPVYLYKDPDTGEEIRKSIYEKHQIPTSVKTKMKWNLCDNRINSLRTGQDYNGINPSGDINVNPNICSLNSDASTLMDEPGMKELQELYYDKYDYSTGKFVGMTENTSKQYKKDLKIFYTAFTGKKDMPPEITKFSDIKLISYQNEKGCQDSNAPFKQSYVGSVKGKDKKGNPSLFYQYAMNIKEMILNTNENQNELLSILFQIFKFVIDPYSGEKKVRINPELTEELLNKLTEQTRRLIIELYVKCEEDYVKGVKLFEAIVESKIMETTQKQLSNLEETKEILTNKSHGLLPSH
jgi:hypothetical protein